MKEKLLTLLQYLKYPLTMIAGKRRINNFVTLYDAAVLAKGGRVPRYLDAGRRKS